MADAPTESPAMKFLEKAKTLADDVIITSEDLKKLSTVEEKKKLIDGVLAMRDKRTVEHVAKMMKQASEKYVKETNVEEKAALASAESEINMHGAALRAEITSQLNAKPVQDLEPAADPNKPKTFVDQVKGTLGGVGVGAMSLLVRGWIMLQRTLIDLGVVAGDKSKLDKIEELYGNWFGGAEMREQMGTALKASGIEIRKGTQDGIAYLRMQESYTAWALKKLPDRKDTDGKVIPPTEAMIKEVKKSATMQMFLSDTAKEYANKYRVAPVDPKKKRVTTLMGISNSEQPSTVDA